MTTFDVSSEYHLGISKVDRYKWGIKDTEGRFMLIDKRQLKVDHAYQREEIKEAKVAEITKNWSWVAMGAIAVVERSPGEYFVMDGMHRVLGSMRRNDIQKLPCMVFQLDGLKDEAKGFLNANENRKPVSSRDKFKAQIVSEDPIALEIQKLLDASGYRASGTGADKTVRCIGTMRRCLVRNKEAFGQVWNLCIDLAQGKIIQERLLLAFMHLHEKTDGKIVWSPYRSRLLKIGAEQLLLEANRAAQFYSKGGERIWAYGIARVFNKGLRTNRIELSEPTA